MLKAWCLRSKIFFFLKRNLRFEEEWEQKNGLIDTEQKFNDTEQNINKWAIWTTDSVVLLNQNFSKVKCSNLSYIKSSLFQFFYIVYFTGINKLGRQYTLKIIPQKNENHSGQQ